MGKDFPQLITILPLLGFVGSLIWLYIGHRSIIVGKYFHDEVSDCEEQLPKDERVYTNAQNWRKETRPPIVGFPVSKCFAYVFPGVWALTWFVLLLWGI